MNPIEILKKEHEQIEMELMELDEVMSTKIINYPVLLHSFKKLCKIWDVHEEKEEGLFSIMRKDQLLAPIYTMSCEHKDLRDHVGKINNSIHSGSDYRIRKSFEDDLKVIMTKIRTHINDEDEILYTTALGEFTKEELIKLKQIINEDLKNIF